MLQQQQQQHTTRLVNDTELTEINSACFVEKG